MEIIIASDNLETAIVPHGAEQPEEEEESSESSSEEENEADLPPGPVDPNKCTVGGPGTAGGSAQAPVSFHIQARDSQDKKLTEGGDYVVVGVLPGPNAQAAGAKHSEAIVRDNGDGSYTATYSVEARGDYQLTVDINGSAFGGSPFPVFFSPPDERAAEAAFTDALGAVVDPSTVSAVTDAPMPVISVLGASAYKAKVSFPEGEDVLERSVIVGEMNPAVNLEQLQKLFSYSGQVQDCKFSGAKNEFAFVTFATPQEAEQALTLDKLLVIDRQIRVEGAQAALDSKGQSGGVQYAALQLQQIQQLRKAQSEQHSLAAQVASMRVQAKQNPTAFVPGLPQNSASQKAAALSAIAALSKRLTGSSHGPTPSNDRDPAPSKKRREVSPTLRYRKNRRSRSRSPARRGMSPPRRRSPPVILRRSPARRRSRDRDRRRDSSRERRRRSRSPVIRREDRASSRYRRDRDRDREERRRRTRSRSQERRRGRDDHRNRKRQRSTDAARSVEEPQKSRRTGAEEDADRSTKYMAEDGSGGNAERSSPTASASPEKQSAHNEPEQNGGSAGNGSKASADPEAQALREKALKALHSLKSMDASNGNDADADAASLEKEQTGDEKKKRRHKGKHHKHSKQKKEKRSRKDADERGDVGNEDLELPEMDPRFSP